MDLTLVIMAAGMGSRFGGIKQIEPIGPNGEMILDYAIYDAKRAGFNKVVFVIKKEIESVFRERVLARINHQINCACVFQETDDLPNGLVCPPGRVKPWGTAHAVLCAKPVVATPFAVINADDFYGAGAFTAIAAFLQSLGQNSAYRYCMAGYALKNTLSESGSVSRGICELAADNRLIAVTERTKIEQRPDGIFYEEDNTLVPIPGDTVVSLNCWGFTPELLDEITMLFPDFYTAHQAWGDLLTAEFYLPAVIKTLLEQKKITVQVLDCQEQWYGFTYPEDKITVIKAIRNLTAAGGYPEKLWG